MADQQGLVVLPHEYLARIDARARYAGQILVNTYYYEVITNLRYDLSLAHLQTRFMTIAQPLYAALFTTDVAMEHCIAARVSRFQQNRFSLTLPWVFAGTNAPPTVPPAVTAVVQRTGQAAGKRFRGRVMYGGFPLDAVVAGKISGASVTFAHLNAMVPLFNQIIATQGLNNTDQNEAYGVLINQKPRGEVLEYEFRPVVTVATRFECGTQRHRLPGHGRRG